MSASELEDVFAEQLDAVGLDGYVREYQAIVDDMEKRFEHYLEAKEQR